MLQSYQLQLKKKCSFLRNLRKCENTFFPCLEYWSTFKSQPLVITSASTMTNQFRPLYLLHRAVYCNNHKKSNAKWLFSNCLQSKLVFAELIWSSIAWVIPARVPWYQRKPKTNTFSKLIVASELFSDNCAHREYGPSSSRNIW